MCTLCSPPGYGPVHLHLDLWSLHLYLHLINLWSLHLHLHLNLWSLHLHLHLNLWSLHLHLHLINLWSLHLHLHLINLWSHSGVIYFCHFFPWFYCSFLLTVSAARIFSPCNTMNIAIMYSFSCLYYLSYQHHAFCPTLSLYFSFRVPIICLCESDRALGCEHASSPYQQSWWDRGTWHESELRFERSFLGVKYRVVSTHAPCAVPRRGHVLRSIT